jgi:hypothetical protein
MELSKETWSEGVDWIEVTLDTVWCLAVVNAALGSS